jgi:hypothetical protein
LNAIAFLTRQIVAGKAFAALVKVIAVHGGGVGLPPTVDVQPLVNQIDGFGNQTPHGIVYGMPCFRLQGGHGAMILDPAVGDTGEAVICDRDISTVKATRAAAGPGSRRQNSWADGCYFGGFLNDAPTRYVKMDAAGTAVVDPLQISLTVGTKGIVITAAGTMIDGKDFLTHEHTGVQTGGGVTGPVA